MQNPTTDTTEETHDDCRLHRFERNRFFNGKLMTARDMEAEQAYHAERLRTVARSALGEGTLGGLGVTVTSTETEVTAVVEPGVALDCCGTPVVVPEQQKDFTFTFDSESILEADTVSVFLTYGECVKESVPIRGSEEACDQECAYNRILEINDVVLEPDEDFDIATAHRKGVPEVEFPTSDDLAGGDEAKAKREALATIARSFPGAGAAGPGGCENPRVYLGTFTENANGSWSRERSLPRSRVYTNDMLYSAIAHHTADFGNPHEVVATVKEVEPDDGGDVEPVSTDGTLTIEPASDPHEVDFRTGPGLREEFDELRKEHEEDLEKLRQDHKKDLEKLRTEHEKHVEELEGKIEDLRKQHEKEVKELHEKIADLREQVESDDGAEELAVEPTVVTVERGRTATFEVTFGGRDSVAVQIGGGGSNYRVAGTLTANGEETATVSFDTVTAGLGRGPVSVSGSATFDQSAETTLADPLAATTYGIRVRSTGSDDPALVVGTLQVQESDFYAFELDTPVTRVEQGETATVGLSLGSAPQAGIRIGDESDQGYELTATLTPGSDDSVDLTFDTDAAGDGEMPLSVSGDADLAKDDETDLTDPLAVGNYDITVTVPGHDDWTVEVGALSVTVPEPETTKVPDVVGRPEAEARAKLESNDLAASVTDRPVTTAGQLEEWNYGDVITQTPGGEETADIGSTVKLDVLVSRPVTELENISTPESEELATVDIEWTHELAAADPEDLAARLEFDPDTIEGWKTEADRSLKELVLGLRQNVDAEIAADTVGAFEEQTPEEVLNMSNEELERAVVDATNEERITPGAAQKFLSTSASLSFDPERFGSEIEFPTDWTGGDGYVPRL